MKKNIYTFFSILILGGIPIDIPYLRYLKYFTFLLFIFACIDSKWKLDKKALKPSSVIYPFLLLCLFYTLSVWNYNRFLFIDLIIISGAFLPFIFIKKIEINLYAVNVLLFVCFLISSGFSFKLDFSKDAFLLSETSEAESNMLPFLFGLLSIFFFMKKNYLFTILNLVFVILSFKRIVFLSVSVVLLFHFFKFYKYRNITFILILCNLLWLYLSYFITTDLAGDICRKITGLPIGQFTQGRTVRYMYVWENFTEDPLKHTLFGMGGGQTRILLSQFFYGESLQLHNDIMKVFIDFGALGFLLFVGFLYRNRKKQAFISLTILLNCFFMTDNVLIYEPVLFLYILLSYEILKTQERKIQLCPKL
jgi:hypothetical protein